MLLKAYVTVCNQTVKLALRLLQVSSATAKRHFFNKILGRYTCRKAFLNEWKKRERVKQCSNKLHMISQWKNYLTPPSTRYLYSRSASHQTTMYIKDMWSQEAYRFQVPMRLREFATTTLPYCFKVIWSKVTATVCFIKTRCSSLVN